MKCIVCGCTQEHACPEGCSWSLYSPPVCSSCVEIFAFARLWGAVMDLESKARRQTRANIQGMRRVWSTLIKDANSTGNMNEEVCIPTLRRIRAINRKVAKWELQPS
jgi:hypothetical protein